MAKIYLLDEFTQVKDRTIFFDANVLIYLFWATGQQHFEKNYARVFNSLRKQGNSFKIDFLVLSEVINRIMRNEFNKIKGSINYKDFRNSDEGREILNDIYTIIKGSILTQFKITEKAFDTNTIESFLQLDELDFIDKAILEICKANNYVLITNDSDFKNSEIEILTGNRKILN